MNITVSKRFYPLLEDRSRYLVLCGGRGSGKSEFAARKLFYRSMAEGGHRWLVMRKVRKSLAESVIRVVRTVLAENDVPHTYNKTDRTVTFVGPHGRNEILFDGLDDPEKIKSIKGITGMWIEETTEFSENDFLMVDLCLREPGPGYHQVILSFNPEEAEAPWLRERFFDRATSAATVHESTIEDNPIREVRETYMRQLDALEHTNPTLYKIYRLGKWAALEGRIYDWNVEPLPDMAFDECWYGGDFGYSVDPAALVKLCRRADEFWLEEIIYQTGLTNQALAAEMRRLRVDPEAPIYFDSAEPKSIEELRREGFSVRPAEKGPDSVRAGIDFIKSRKVHIVQGSDNLLKESKHYCWRKDRSGKALPEPVKFEDHLMDAVRYGIYSHVGRSVQIGCEWR